MLPNELISLILEELEATGEKVSRYLPVSRQFRHAVLRLLFNRLEVTCQSRGDAVIQRSLSRANLLHEILQNHPELINAIRRVRIRFPLRQANIAYDPDIARALRELSSAPIQSLEIRALIDSSKPREEVGDSVLWEGPAVYTLSVYDLPTEITQALIVLRCKPSLRHLVLHRVDANRVPPLLLFGVPDTDAVTTLQVKYVTVQRYKNESHPRMDFLFPFDDTNDQRTPGTWPMALSRNTSSPKPIADSYHPLVNLTTFDLCGSFKPFIKFFSNLAGTIQEGTRVDNPVLKFSFPALKTLAIQTLSDDAKDGTEFLKLVGPRAPNLETVSFSPRLVDIVPCPTSVLLEAGSQQQTPLPNPLLIETLTRVSPQVSTLIFTSYSTIFNAPIQSLRELLSVCMDNAKSQQPIRPCLPISVTTLKLCYTWILVNSRGLYKEGAAGVLNFKNKWAQLATGLKEVKEFQARALARRNLLARRGNHTGTNEDGGEGHVGLEVGLNRVELDLRIVIKPSSNQKEMTEGREEGFDLEVFERNAKDMVDRMASEAMLEVVYRLNVETIAEYNRGQAVISWFG